MATDYSDGQFFHYTYDPMGNRLTQVTQDGTNTYTYDEANRLTSVDDVPYTWDEAGNLLSDGENTYSYDSANRLTTVNGPSSTVGYTYSGLGDRLQQTVDGVPITYTLDLNAGLTQVLSDGTYTYLYGLGRIAEVNAATEYFLGDTLGSVRQLADANGKIAFSQDYQPYGEALASEGDSASAYGFTGEMSDPSGLMYLRARYYDPDEGRFINRDTWEGDAYQPMSYNSWVYVYSNPINFTDPSGHVPGTPPNVEPNYEQVYGINIAGSWQYKDKEAIYDAVFFVGSAFNNIIGGTPGSAFRAVYRNMTITWGLSGASGTCDGIGVGGCTSSAHQINFATISSDSLRARNNVVHELGHAFEDLWNMNSTYRLDAQNVHPAIVLGWTQSCPGHEEYYIKNFPNRPNFPDPTPQYWRGAYWGFASRQGVLTWQVSVVQAGALTEEFADQFLGWVFGMWEDSEAGRMRADWMDEYMGDWVRAAAEH